MMEDDLTKKYMEIILGDINDKLLEKYIREYKKARIELSKIYRTSINERLMDICLIEHFDLEKEIDIISYNLDSKDIVAILKNSDNLYPVYNQEIQVDMSLLASNLPQPLTEQIAKHKGVIWNVHKYDKDVFPSNPHAHNYEENVKLNLFTGELFKKKECIGKLSAKDLSSIKVKLKI